MRGWGLFIATFAIGCGGTEQCSQRVTCAGGQYQMCTSGVACRYLTSDGHSFACASCSDCAAAVAAAASWCGVPGGGARDGGSDGGGGGAVMQSQPCIDYLSCAGRAVPSQLPSLAAMFGPDGSCWQSASQAATCTTACVTGLQQLQIMNACDQTTTPSCSDGRQDGDERDIDCGGSCAPCGAGQQCGVNADCSSGICSNQRCIDGTPLGGAVYAVGKMAVSSPSGFTITTQGSGLRLTWFSPGHPVRGSIYASASFGTEDSCHGSCSRNVRAYFSAVYPLPNNAGWRSDFESDSPLQLTEGMDINGPPGTPQPIYFDLYVDGKHQPMLVVFDDGTTNQASSPVAIPFGLQLP